MCPAVPLYGDVPVFHDWKPLATCLSLFILAAVVGCNRGGEENSSPTTSIGGSSDATPTEGGSSGPALHKPDSDPQHPVVLIETSLGNMTIRLDAEKAPLTVDNFLFYVDAGHYDQTIVHQVYKEQGILCGGYGVNLVEKPARTSIRNEAHNGLKNHRGTIAMVRQPDAIDSATCQFFINVADNPALDFKDRTPEGYGYCVFGTVAEGMETVDKITDTPVHDTTEFERTPIRPVIVKSVRRTR